MANILTDTTASFKAEEVLGEKVNSIVRASSDSTTHVIAQWGNFVDDAMERTNAFFTGEEQAVSGSFTGDLNVDGDMTVGDDFTVTGDFIAPTGSFFAVVATTGSFFHTSATFMTIGGTDTSFANVTARDLVIGSDDTHHGMTIRAGTNFAASIFFAEAGDNREANITCDFATNEMEFFVADSDQVFIGAGYMSPDTAGDTDLGEVAREWGTIFCQSGTFSEQVRGKILWYSFHYYQESGVTKRIIPWGHDNDRGTVIVSGTNGLAPHDGELKEVIILTQNVDGMGTTMVEFHDAILSSSQVNVEGVTGTIPDNTAGVSFPFSASFFDKGDPLVVKIEPTVGPDEITVTCIWEYDQNT